MTGFEQIDRADSDDLARAYREGEEEARGFGRELSKSNEAMKEAQKEAKALSQSISSSLQRAFKGLAMDGMSLTGALDQVGQSIVTAALQSATKPVSDQLGTLIGTTISGLMGASSQSKQSFSDEKIKPFAKGGVISGATTFAMNGATGVMGEAGPEAIMPLKRGADGRLGIEAGGTQRPMSVNVTISTPNLQSFQRSESQIAAQMSRALSRGTRLR